VKATEKNVTYPSTQNDQDTGGWKVALFLEKKGEIRGKRQPLLKFQKPSSLLVKHEKEGGPEGRVNFGKKKGVQKAFLHRA